MAEEEDGVPDKAEDDDQGGSGDVELDGEEETVVPDAKSKSDDAQDKSEKREIELALLFGERVGDGEERVGREKEPHPGQKSVEIRCGASPLGAENETEERLGIEIEESEDGQGGEADDKGEASDKATKRQTVAQPAVDFDVKDPLGGSVEDVDRPEGESQSKAVETYLGIGDGEGGGEPDEGEVAGERIDKVFGRGEERKLAKLTGGSDAFGASDVGRQIEAAEMKEVVDVAGGLPEDGTKREAYAVKEAREGQQNLEQSPADGDGEVGPDNLRKAFETVEKSSVDARGAAEEDKEGDEERGPAD